MLSVPLDLIYLNPDALTAWPVTWGVPLAAGAVTDEATLSLRDPQGRPMPLQSRVLKRHADGSIARLLIHSEVDVPPECTQTFKLCDDGQPSNDSDQSATAMSHKLAGGIGELALNDGVLTLTPASAGEATYTLSLHAVARQGGEDTDSIAEQVAFTWQAFEPFESGPILAAAVLEARSDRLTARITIRLPRTQPVMFVDVLVKNLSEHTVVEADCFDLMVSRNARAWRSSTREIRQMPAAVTSSLPVSVRAKKLAIEVVTADGQTQRGESRLLNYNETWFALDTHAANVDEDTQPRERLIAGFRNFYELFPAGIDADASTLTFALYPSWAETPWRLEQGRGKTHELALALQRGDELEAMTPRAFGYAFGKPPMPRVPVEQHHGAGSLTGLLSHMPDTYPRIETMLYDMTYNRNRGYGKMHWGDDYSVLYTNQLRGKYEIVWNNLEGDHPFHMFRQFVRTGRYIYFKEFRDSVLHWADVDFCDRHADAMKQGALTVHSAGHTSGGASPCHNWAESFREWYFATGDPRPLDIIKQMADWLLRQADAGFFKTDPQPYVRGCGWGLIQMAAIQDVCERDDIAALVDDLAHRLLDYCRANDGLRMLIPTGGNWTLSDNAFHTATVVLGAFRHWERTKQPVYRELAVEAAQVFMDERTCTPEGLPVYITGPEQDFPMQQAAGLTLAGLAVAYTLTCEERYVRRGMRMLEYCLDRGMIVDHMRIPGEFITIGDDVILNVPMLMPNTQLLSYQLRGLLLFMRAAHDAGMLKQVDYQY